MVSKRIKYARAHLSRRRHIAILATPSWRQTQSTDFNNSPRPFSVSRAALRARANKRIKMMAQPKIVRGRYEPSHSRVSLQYPRTHRETLSAETSKRLFDLALPKKREKIRRKLCRALTKPGDWERHKRVLEKLAAPKRVHKPPKPTTAKKGETWDPIRLDELAKPVRKNFDLGRDPFSVHRRALFYNISEHLTRLAQSKYLNYEPEINLLGYVSPTALRAYASSRILELAKPAQRPAGLETDLKEDAFTVPPRALKAICTPRIKILARPKKRNRR